MYESLKGLTGAQVEERVLAGKVNSDYSVKTKTVKRIVYENIFTLFNLINLIFAIAVLLAGSLKNLLFLGVVLCNTAIGIIQEIRSKRAVDKLAIIVSQKATAIRDGVLTEIGVNDIVIDDLLRFKRGDQICADCIVVSGQCSADERLLTGESDLIHKYEGEKLFSGSFISSGECYARVEKIGKDCYAAQINNEAKYVKKVNSEIMNSLNKILRFAAIIIFPLGAVLLYRQISLAGVEWSDAVVSVTAALIGMIPEGLILLTSTVLAVSVVRLSRKKVLVQELYCIETLAHIDVLCLDKTGTITTGEMRVERVEALGGADLSEVNTALASLGKVSRDGNSTIAAIRESFQKYETLCAKKVIDFTSESKWSGAFFENGKSYVIGAGEFINKEKYLSAIADINVPLENYRVLALASVNAEIDEKCLPPELEFIALVFIGDTVRSGAAETISYFERQGVKIKVISGDNPKTVFNVAKQAGIEGCENYIDASVLTTEREIAQAAEKYTVFGRVTPQRKKQLIKALKNNGHSVAMTGDGVNDVLALKEADCSVAMASGSEAARNISQLVLINNDFSAMPSVVGEGRRTINNIQRSASLFLVKTLYAMLLAVSFIFIKAQYPFEPIQMSLISAFTIGIPSFVLALEPNNERVTGRFLKNVISKAIPAAVTIVLNIYLSLLAGRVFSLPYAEISTLAVVLTAVTEFMLICRISTPFTKIRAALFIFITAGFTFFVLAFKDLFSIAALNIRLMLIFAILAVIAFLIFNGIYYFIGHMQNFKRRKDKRFS